MESGKILVDNKSHLESPLLMSMRETQSVHQSTAQSAAESETVAVKGAIQRAVNDYVGKDCELKYHDRIDETLELAGIRFFEELGYCEFEDVLRKHTGVRLDENDWSYLSGINHCKSMDEWEARYAASFTFERLVEFISRRLNLPTVDDVTILGRSCKSAGAFFAIQEVIKADWPTLQPVAPSTPIVQRFVVINDLISVWAKFQVMSHGRLPDLQIGMVGNAIQNAMWPLGCFFALPVAGGMLGLLQGLNLGTPISVLGAIVSVPLLFWGMHLIQRIFDSYQRATRRTAIRLPNGIRTFGDVARIIAGERGGWCNECGYDLTGIVDDRCPECGAASKPRFVFPTKRDQSPSGDGKF